MQRLLYRLALGQPNQADFVRALEKRVQPGSRAELRSERVLEATINLGEVGYRD